MGVESLRSAAPDVLGATQPSRRRGLGGQRSSSPSDALFELLHPASYRRERGVPRPGNGHSCSEGGIAIPWRP